MKVSALIVVMALAAGAAAAPSFAQVGRFGRILDQGKKAVETADALTFSDAEERQMGADISTKLRNKYGVVQDRAVHRYVTLVGRVLAAGSARPNLAWTFIVLDTDGVNAFAAPGGFIHITRGALALIRNEAELADVLAHEMIHVTAKHTLNAVRKSKAVGVASTSARSDLLREVTDRTYEAVLENSFDRGDEIESDSDGVALANKAGYAPGGLAAFLIRLGERNKNLKERSGMFASHPEAKARTDALSRAISSAKLTATALVAARYAQAVAFKPVPVTAVALAPAGTSTAAKPSGGGLGLSGMSAIGRDRSSGDTVSSAGSRGVNPDRDAAGGPVKTLVTVAVSAADLAQFRKGITG